MKIDRTNCKTDIAGRFDPETSRSARISSALGYLLFFVPMVMHPESKFARYHTNQGFLLMLLMTVGVALAAMVPYAGPFLVIPVMLFGDLLRPAGNGDGAALSGKAHPAAGEADPD